MLVKLNSHDRGSTLVSVIVVMLVLTVIALTTTAVTVSTTRGLVTTRDTAQSRAAADAGLAAAIAAFKKQKDCPVSAPTSATEDLVYETECEKVGGQVTFRSTGSAGSSSETTIEAIYLLPPPLPQKEPALVTRAPLSLDSLTIKAVDPSNPATVWVIPDAGKPGDFACNSGGAIAGSVYLPVGTVFGSGGCKVSGDVYAEGKVEINGGTGIGGDLVSLNGAVTIDGGSTVGGGVYAKGNVTIKGGPTIHGDIASLAGSASVTGGVTIDGSIHAKANFTGSGLSGRFVESIHAGGNLSLAGGKPVARDRITYGGTFTYADGQHDDWAAKSVTHTATRPVVHSPQLPTAPDWVGFTQSDLDALVDNNLFTKVAWSGACAYSWWPEHEMISKIKGFTTPTLVDARHCARLDLHQYSGITELRTDVIFVAPSFNIEDQDFKSADGAEHRLWFISPEVEGRDCSAVPKIAIKGTIMVPNGGSKISGMIFTQCTVDFPNGGEGWQGTIQAGAMVGKPNFWYKPVGFPGQPSPGDEGGGADGTPPALGGLLSLRDVP